MAQRVDHAAEGWLADGLFGVGPEGTRNSTHAVKFTVWIESLVPVLAGIIHERVPLLATDGALG
jgi:hypothetical protein